MKKQKSRRQKSNQKKKRKSANVIGRIYRHENALRVERERTPPQSLEELFGY